MYDSIATSTSSAMREASAVRIRVIFSKSWENSRPTTGARRVKYSTARRIVHCLLGHPRRSSSARSSRLSTLPNPSRPSSCTTAIHEITNRSRPPLLIAYGLRDLAAMVRTELEEEERLFFDPDLLRGDDVF